MAITGTGKWDEGSATKRPVQDRDFFSGDMTVSNTTYATADDQEFGFAAPEVHIFNTGGTRLVLQWLSRPKTENKDSGVVPAGGSLVLRNANKQGVRFRVESGSTNCYVLAAG